MIKKYGLLPKDDCLTILQKVQAVIIKEQGKQAGKMWWAKTKKGSTLDILNSIPIKEIS